MFINILLLIIGFSILIKGADWFVDGASDVAGNFRVSKMLIGLTIVAFGTSAPELAVSIKSLLSGSGDIVMGNVIGSNILNILLILGCAALVHPLTVKNATVKKEIPILLLITTLFCVLLSDRLFENGLTNLFTRSDGIVLLLFFVIFIYYLFTLMKNKVDNEKESEIMPLWKCSFLTVVGILCIVFGSNLVVDKAVLIAADLGISERMIALTVIALGTSLPELVTSITATIKGEYDIAVGNVIGSNLFNVGVVVALPVMLFGGISNITFNYIDLGVMLLSVFLLFLFSLGDRKIIKVEGIIFLLIFVSYYSYIIFG